ncbi:MAG: hypothetical protein ACK56I_05330, partial [bacterium]
MRAFRSGSACTDDGLAAAASDAVLSGHGAPVLAVAITRPSSGAGITGTFAVPTRRTPEQPAVPLGVLVLG